jgi:hypothetical protein
LFLILWGAQHYLVSIALAGVMASNNQAPIPRGSVWYGWWEPWTRSFGRTVLVLILASVVLTPILMSPFHPEWLPGIFAAFKRLLANPAWVKLLIAINYSSLFIHFLFDRAVFRFSQPAVRAVSAPLVFGS